MLSNKNLFLPRWSDIIQHVTCIQANIKNTSCFDHLLSLHPLYHCFCLLTHFILHLNLLYITPFPIHPSPTTPIHHRFPPVIVLLILTRIASVHRHCFTYPHWQNRDDEPGMCSLWWKTYWCVFVCVLVCMCDRQARWEHVLTSLSAHPSVNLWDASWYSRTGWAQLTSCLPAHQCKSVLPVNVGLCPSIPLCPGTGGTQCASTPQLPCVCQSSDFVWLCTPDHMC